MATVAELGIKVDSSGVVRAGSELDKFGRTAQTAEKRTDTFSKTATKATTASKNFGNGARNLSLQLSQVAQQGAVTGDFFRALTIQLPDILLSFGTLGILVGAAAGALGGPLIEALSGAEDKTEDLTEDIDALINKFDELGSAQKDLLALKVAEETTRLSKEIRIAEGNIATAITKFDSLGRALQRGSIDTLEFNEKAEELNRTIVDNRAVIEANKDTIAERQRVLSGAAKQEELAAEAVKRQNEALKEQESIRRVLNAQLSQVESTLASPAERAAMQFEKRNEIIQQANDDQLLQEGQYDQLRMANAQRLSADLLRLEEKTQKEKDAILSSGQQATLAVAGQLFGNLAALAKEGGRDQFDEYKALASAQAAVAAGLAIAQALAAAPPPLNFALAGTIGALAMVQIAKINNQEYTGARVMGGQVSGGSSYLVGENGPEVVTMGANGFVTPNRMLGGGGDSVTIVQNFTAGVTKSELAGVLPQVAEAAKQATLAAIGGGGTASQAVRRRR